MKDTVHTPETDSDFQFAMLPNQVDSLVTPGKNVACVYTYNTLEHALLVLIKSGYSAVPVLGLHESVYGTVSKTNILEAILEVDQMNIAKLSETTVEQVADTSAPLIKPTVSFQRAIDLLINRSFLCVVDEQDRFYGLLTRRTVLIEVANQLRVHRKN